MKKIARLLAMGICVLLVTLLLRGYTAAFTAAQTMSPCHWETSMPFLNFVSGVVTTSFSSSNQRRR